MNPRGYLSIFTTELRVHTPHLGFSPWDLSQYPRHCRGQEQSGLKGQAKTTSEHHLLNIIHGPFQRELHGMTSTNPPPQGNNRMSEEQADGGMSAIQMHRESLLSGGRLMQVTTPAMHTAQPAPLDELWTG